MEGMRRVYKLIFFWKKFQQSMLLEDARLTIIVILCLINVQVYKLYSNKKLLSSNERKDGVTISKYK